MREIKGKRIERPVRGVRAKIISKPVARVGLQLSTGRKMQPVNARVPAYHFHLKGNAGSCSDKAR